MTHHGSCAVQAGKAAPGADPGAGAVKVARPTWVFGYGSLIWKQDFPFLGSRPGYILGWSRRFWQGSHDHRGLPHAPGRVVTLAAEPGARCDGCAFLVEPPVFEHLDHREKNGYERVAVDIHFADGPVRGVVYRAHERNPAFLGPASLDAMVEQVASARGPSGSNRGYVLELARALRELGVADEHVFSLERRLLDR
jgi:cation transport regulator ChaC